MVHTTLLLRQYVQDLLLFYLPKILKQSFIPNSNFFLTCYSTCIVLVFFCYLFADWISFSTVPAGKNTALTQIQAVHEVITSFIRGQAGLMTPGMQNPFQPRLAKK